MTAVSTRTIIRVLEPLFLTVAQPSYDRELTQDIVGLLKPLVDEADLEATRHLVERHAARLRQIIAKVRTKASGAGIMLSQPEGLLLLHLLETKRNQLRVLWETTYAVDWLEDVAEQWGIRLGARD